MAAHIGTVYPATPPATDLSRSQLKALTKWIRDDLDLLVAREGPNVLRPDDVLTLHDTFVQLRLSTTITALDLRASGIHRAIQDIAGVATRWPGRLCDDCDKIIELWTMKFGPFGEIRPFLYGRGGRLEGIASATEHSREALLKRWSETCPEMLHPKRSHRHGDLGFRAGDWWINTLFAHHAGIIGLEAVEGGTTFDKIGAYALVLKDTGEVEANSEERFTYRCPQIDKGKFRLTAATPISRDPVRVLRSHSINSVWGPKAGVRYEGLYSVSGWSIRQAKKADVAGGEWKEGDIVFEVRFERKDPVPMDEVMKRPTTTEVDDYSEYKRLRKLHREVKRKAPGREDSPTKIELPQPIKAAPPIMPLALPPIGTPKIPTGGVSPTIVSRKTAMFKRPHFEQPEQVSGSPAAEPFSLVSPKTTLETDYFVFSPSKSSTLTVPVRGSLRQSVQSIPASPGGTHITPNPTGASPHTSSPTGSGHTGASVQANIQEVTPWVDFEAEISLPSSEDIQGIASGDVSPQVLRTSAKKKMAFNSPDRVYTPPVSPRRESRKSADEEGSAKALKESRKSVFVRSRNPMAKLFDGAASSSDEQPPTSEHQRGSSSGIRSPVPMRPFSPDSPFRAGRRDAIYTDSGEEFPAGLPIMVAVEVREEMGVLSYPKDDPFVDTASAMPMSLKKFISRPRAATPMGSIDMTPSSPPSPWMTDAAYRLRKSLDADVKITFRNPFSGMGSPRKKGKGKRCSGEVAPETVV